MTFKRASEFKDYLAFLVLYAPNEFPAWRNLTIESALERLEIGVNDCSAMIGDEVKVMRLKELAASVSRSYRANESVTAAHLLQDMMRLL